MNRIYIPKESYKPKNKHDFEMSNGKGDIFLSLRRNERGKEKEMNFLRTIV